MKKENKIVLGIFFTMIVIIAALFLEIPSRNYKYVKKILQNKKYTETSEFVELYKQKIEYLKNYISSYIYSPNNIAIYKSNLNAPNNAFEYLCIVYKTGSNEPIYLTNIEFIDQQSFISTVEQNSAYYSFDGKNYSTNIEGLNDIRYNYTTGYTYKIYTRVNEDNSYDDIGAYVKNYNDTVAKVAFSEILMPIAIVIAAILFVYLSVYYITSKKDSIKKSFFDSIPLEVLCILSFVIIYFCIYILSGKSNLYIDILEDSLIGQIILVLIILVTFWITYRSIIYRIKDKSIYTNTLTCKFIQNTKKVTDNIGLVYKYILITVFVFLINIVLGYLVIYYIKVINEIKILWGLLLLLIDLVYIMYISKNIIEYTKNIESTDDMKNKNER